jgi:hypothetical protein
MTRLGSGIMLITVCATLLVQALHPSNSESRAAPPNEAKADEPKMSLVFANRLHRHFQSTCDLPDCKIRYAGELGYEMPKKVFVVGYNYEACCNWDVLYQTPRDQLPKIVTRLEFRLEKREDQLASTKINGETVYCYLAKQAHDDTPESLRKEADQPITAFATVEKLKKYTPRMIACHVLR